MRKCACGCGAILKQRPHESKYAFEHRIYDARACSIKVRKSKGKWKSGCGKKKCECLEVETCPKCHKPKLNLHCDGFGITEPEWFCIHGLKWSQERRAFI